MGPRKDPKELSNGMLAVMAFVKFANGIWVALHSSTSSYVSDYNPNRRAQEEAQPYFAELGRRIGSTASDSFSTSSKTVSRETTDVIGARAIAYVIDGLIRLGIFFIMIFPAVIIPSNSSAISPLFYLFGLLSIPLYGILLEGFWNGQTIGKRLLNIQVVNNDGEYPSTKQAVIRNVPAIFGFFNWMMLAVALLSIVIDDTNRRVFDRIANTYVTRA